MIQQHRLDRGQIEKLVLSLRCIDTASPEVAEKIRTEAEYFERNAERMRYPKFRQQHLFVGSGVMEAGCKTVIGSRLKQSGMFWTVREANAAANSMAGSRITGRRGALESDFYVAHPIVNWYWRISRSLDFNFPPRLHRFIPSEAGSLAEPGDSLECSKARQAP